MGIYLIERYDFLKDRPLHFMGEALPCSLSLSGIRPQLTPAILLLEPRSDGNR